MLLKNTSKSHIYKYLFSLKTKNKIIFSFFFPLEEKILYFIIYEQKKRFHYNLFILNDNYTMT